MNAYTVTNKSKTINVTVFTDTAHAAMRTVMCMFNKYGSKLTVVQIEGKSNSVIISERVMFI